MPVDPYRFTYRISAGGRRKVTALEEAPWSAAVVPDVRPNNSRDGRLRRHSGEGV